MLLLGNFQHTLDDKNRIRLPADFRKEMGDSYYLMPGNNGGIFVYKADDSHKVIEQLLSLDGLNPERSLEMEFITAYSRSVTADNQGRFMLPEDLIEMMEIKKDVHIVGATTKVVIWSEERWQEMFVRKEKLTPEKINRIYSSLDQELIRREKARKL